MPDNVLESTTLIVSSFLGKNQASGSELTTLIRAVHTALADAAAPPPEPPPPQTPAVSIRRSITPDAILCMECGKSFKTLRRHLRTDHDLSREAYRSKWSLPKTYPMTAPDYSAARSRLAKSSGLGASGKTAARETVTAPRRALPLPKLAWLQKLLNQRLAPAPRRGLSPWSPKRRDHGLQSQAVQSENGITAIGPVDTVTGLAAHRRNLQFKSRVLTKPSRIRP